MRSDSPFSPQDLVRGIGFYGLFSLIFVLLFFEVGVFALIMIPFLVFIGKLSDIVHKDLYDPPYNRCTGCGKLYNEEKFEEDTSFGRFCRHCSKATISQKKFAAKIPKLIKRLVV